MKKVFPIVLSLLMPFLNSDTPYANSGISSHQHFPHQVGTLYTVSIPFYFAKTTVFSFEYSVYNSAGVNTYTKPRQTVTIRAGFTYFIRHAGHDTEFGIGRNYIQILYQFDGVWQNIYYGYFYCYDARTPVSINDGDNGAAILNNEALNTYYPTSNNSVTEIMYFDTKPFKNRYVLQTDLYFDLSGLTTQYLNYDNTLSYDGVRLSFSDHSIFPKMPTFVGKKAVHLSIELINNKLYFSPRYQLYVDPKTHIISYTKEPGYIVTDRIYFPRDKFEALSSTDITMTITNFSHGGFTLEYNFKFNVLAKYFGADGLFGVEVERY